MPSSGSSPSGPPANSGRPSARSARPPGSHPGLPGGLHHLGANPAGRDELLLPRRLEPVDAPVHAGGLVGGLLTGRLVKPGAVGPGGGQRPVGLLGVGADAGHPVLRRGEHLGEAAERTGNLPEGALGDVQVRGISATRAHAGGSGAGWGDQGRPKLAAMPCSADS